MGLPNPDLEQLRAILAAQIIKTLDRRHLTVRAAETLTGLPAADFSTSDTQSWPDLPSTAL